MATTRKPRAKQEELIKVVPIRVRLGKALDAISSWWGKIAPVALSFVVWGLLLFSTIGFFLSSEELAWVAVVLLVILLGFTLILGAILARKLDR